MTSYFLDFHDFRKRKRERGAGGGGAGGLTERVNSLQGSLFIPIFHIPAVAP